MALTTKLVTTTEEFRALEAQWAALHETAQGTVFQTLLWLGKWWEIYADRSMSLRVLTMWNERTLVAVLPMFLEVNRIVFLSLRRMRFLGTYETYGEYEPLVHPDFTGPAAHAMAEWCGGEVRTRACDVITFFRFRSASTPMETMLAHLGSKEYHMKHDPQAVARVMMELPVDWQAYLKMLSSTEREILKRRSRSLEKSGATLEVVREPADADFDDYVRLHGATWNGRGVHGYFASPRFEKFHRAVTRELMTQGKSRLYFLKKDGERFAAVHAYFVNNQCVFYLSGLDRHHELVRFSPGKVLLSYVIRDAIAEGCELFDFQGGVEEYKFRLGGIKTGFAKSVIWKRGPRSLKVVFVLGLQGVYNSLVGGFWAYRIAPRLHKLHKLFSPRPRPATA